MKLRTILLLIITHIVVGGFGFAMGIYALPLLTAPISPTASELKQLSNQAVYTANFEKNLEGSDFLHWGEGLVTIGDTFVALNGKLAPGPDYKLYFSPEFVENEDQFNQLKSSMERVADIKTFNNFMVNIDSKINLQNYNSIVVWCESFGEFITSAKYR